MAVTLGALKNRILFDTNRDSSTYGDSINKSIVTAISFMQSKYFWNFKKFGQVIIPNGKNSINLPDDYQNMITIQFSIGNTLYSLNQGFINTTFEDLIARYNTTAQTGISKIYAVYNNVLYVFPLTAGDTTFTVYYYYKDTFLPATDADSSIWFANDTIDLIRLKAMERFYHDTLQSPEIAAAYALAFNDFESNFCLKNNNKQQYNMLST